jgi:phosphotransferase system  glucose/maltose/N-acetylglucosamine-specific IIC component
MMDTIVRLIYTMIVSIVALLALFIMPPIGILLLLYLRSVIRHAGG